MNGDSINTSHVIASGGITAMLADVIIWIGKGHWNGWLLVPPPPDSETASSLAGLLVAAAGGIFHFFRSKDDHAISK